MTPTLTHLQPYPFERLAKIKQAAAPVAAKTAIDLSIGEPKHPTPIFIKQELINTLDSLGNYPTTRGSGALRLAIRDWLLQRYKLSAHSVSAEENILPVNGTREALFAIAQCVIDAEKQAALVISPNPFYQIYEGAALLAGAKPYYLNCTAEHAYQANFAEVKEEVWQACQLIYLCSPSNPTGAVIPQSELIKLIKLAQKYDFVIAADECYSEIYLNEDRPPIGLLQAASQAGYDDFHNCLVFHSLSKRSNVPGLRSGFVAGDKRLIKQFLLYRTYHGCAMPLPSQYASIAAWQDEQHVRENRQLYRQKFTAVAELLQPELTVELPEAGFYLWPEVPIDDVSFATGLLKTQNVTVLPGSFLARQSLGINPGENRVRIALVASLDETLEAAHRIKQYIQSITS